MFHLSLLVKNISQAANKQQQKQNQQKNKLSECCVFGSGKKKFLINSRSFSFSIFACTLALTELIYH